MVSTFDLGWLVGILEGEGCFLIQNNSPRIQLKMTDYDVVIKAALIMNLSSSRVREKDMKDSGRKQAYTFSLSGTEAIKWMKLIRPYMCARRGAKIDEIVNIMSVSRPNIELGKDFCEKGGHSIKYPWEYYINSTNGGRTCKRCLGVKIRPPIELNGLKLVNPFNKEDIA